MRTSPALARALRALAAVAVLALTSVPATASIPREVLVLEHPAAPRDGEVLVQLAGELVSAPALEPDAAAFIEREPLPPSAAEARPPKKPHQGSRPLSWAWHQELERRNAQNAVGMRPSEDEEGVGKTFSGKYYDREANLFYFNARYYDPDTGRFISQDGFDYGNTSEPPSLLLYYYALNNPLRYVDPDGHESVSKLLEDQIGKAEDQGSLAKMTALSFAQGAYKFSSAITFGWIEKHDVMRDDYEEGKISVADYLSGSAKEGAKSGALMAATVATGGVAGAGARVAGLGATGIAVTSGAGAGLGYQATEDIFKGEMSSVSTYATSIGLGAGGGLAFRGGQALKQIAGAATVGEAPQVVARVVSEGRTAMATVKTALSTPARVGGPPAPAPSAGQMAMETARDTVRTVRLRAAAREVVREVEQPVRPKGKPITLTISPGPQRIFMSRSVGYRLSRSPSVIVRGRAATSARSPSRGCSAQRRRPDA